MTTSMSIDRLDRAEQALAECRTIEDAQAGIAIAEAARYAAARVKAGTRMENYATSIRLKYEIRLAELVDEGQAAGEIETRGGRHDSMFGARTLTLTELGIDRVRLHEARQIAATFTPADIDAIIDDANAEDRAMSRRALLIAAARSERPPATASSTPDFTATERQRRHRLKERMRPSAPLPREVDPLEVAFGLLKKVAALDESPAALGDIAEGIKQIAWWPRP